MNINLTTKEIQLIKKALINQRLSKAEEEIYADILEKFENKKKHENNNSQHE
jgi:hypothetical protein